MLLKARGETSSSRLELMLLKERGETSSDVRFGHDHSDKQMYININTHLIFCYLYISSLPSVANCHNSLSLSLPLSLSLSQYVVQTGWHSTQEMNVDGAEAEIPETKEKQQHHFKPHDLALMTLPTESISEHL